jgi:hypothetical protein
MTVWVNHFISSALQSLPLFTQLWTYRCVAASVEKGQTDRLHCKNVERKSTEKILDIPTTGIISHE